MRCIPLRGFRSFPTRRIAIFPAEGKNLCVRRPPVTRPLGPAEIAHPPGRHQRRSGGAEGAAARPRPLVQAAQASRRLADRGDQASAINGEAVQIIDPDPIQMRQRDRPAPSRDAAGRFPPPFLHVSSPRMVGPPARGATKTLPPAGARGKYGGRKRPSTASMKRQPAPPRLAEAIGGAAAIHERDKPAPRPVRETGPRRIPGSRRAPPPVRGRARRPPQVREQARPGRRTGPRRPCRAPSNSARGQPSPSPGSRISALWSSW